MNGADWLLAALAAEGMPFLFGNPGSTELPITDALGRQEGVRYVLALHESVAMGMLVAVIWFPAPWKKLRPF